MPDEPLPEHVTIASGKDVHARELPVFHGTRRSCALAIFEHGFRPAPVDEQIAAVAEAHEIPVETLLTDLEAHHRYAHLDKRPGTVSLTADPDHAGSWANRAPEATWEALWAVYRLRHPELGSYWNNSGEGHFWVLAQQISDPPVFIAATAPLGRLQAWPHERTAADLLLDLVRAGQPDAFPKLFMGAPEWRADPCHLKLAGFQEVPTRLDRNLATFMSSNDPATFNDQVREGHWGEPGGYHATMPWWSFEEIWRRLTLARREELEVLAGHPLG
jgi:hypothetical protein